LKGKGTRQEKALRTSGYSMIKGTGAEKGFVSRGGNDSGYPLKSREGGRGEMG